MKKLIISLWVLLFINVLSLVGYSETKKEIIIRGYAGSGKGQVGFKIDGSGGPYEAIPSAITVDSVGNIYIADIANGRILKFNQHGKVISTIQFKVEKKGFYKIADDLAVDNADNLLVARVAKIYDMKIDKYSPSGRLVMSVDLNNKQICWSDKKKWIDCAIQIHHMSIDIGGNIYLEGNNELIKFSPKGLLVKKWSSPEHPIYVLDEAGNLYFEVADNMWGKYDKYGNDLGTVGCVAPYFRKKDNNCDYARFVDKDGFAYFYEMRDTSDQSEMIKFDKKGNKIAATKIQPYGNLDKFSPNGDIYSFVYRDNEFYVEKISW